LKRLIMSMNINVCVKTPGLKEFMTQVSARSEETVRVVLDKVAASQLLAFPEISLVVEGKRAEPSASLAAAGVTNGSTVDFVLESTVKSLVAQLGELLKARALTFDELGLLYCYRYGLSLNQALKTLGVSGTLKDMVAEHSDFEMNKGKVGLVKAGEPASAPAAATVAAVLQAPAAAPAPKKTVPAVNAPAEERARTPKKARSKEPSASPRAGSPGPKWAPAVNDALFADEQAFQELHTKVSGRSFHSKISQDLRRLQQQVEDACFLTGKEVVRGGPVGRGTALVGNEDAELVIFVRGVPACGHEKWLPRLHQAVATALEPKVAPELVAVTSKGIDVGSTRIKISPAFESYTEAVQALGVLGPDSRPYFDAAFVNERNAFIGKQPGSVKATMRLLKWWRDQQSFSCELTRPSDELLELLAIYVSQQSGKQPLGESVKSCMTVLAHLDDFRAVWTNFYTPQDVWAPLMAQRPLLMDPVNPFRNVMDPQEFDPRELIYLARTSTFW
jgi:hypothetical protein